MGNKLINFKKKLLRLWQSCNIVVGVLSLAPCCVRKKQVRDKGVPLSYHHGKAVSSLVDDCQTMHPPPALILRLERERTEGRKTEKFYIYLDDTHTHTPGRSRVNPERQEEEKSEHRRRAEGQNSAGGAGEQTDLQNQPTRRNGPDQNSAHT